MFGYPIRMFLCFSSTWSLVVALDLKLVIRRWKCQGLIGLHNFSGADWGGKFVGINKKTWVVAYLKFDDTDDAINCFQELGEGPITKELVNG